MLILPLSLPSTHSILGPAAGSSTLFGVSVILILRVPLALYTVPVRLLRVLPQLQTMLPSYTSVHHSSLLHLSIGPISRHSLPPGYHTILRTHVHLYYFTITSLCYLLVLFALTTLRALRVRVHRVFSSYSYPLRHSHLSCCFTAVRAETVSPPFLSSLGRSHTPGKLRYFRHPVRPEHYPRRRLTIFDPYQLLSGHHGIPMFWINSRGVLCRVPSHHLQRHPP